MNRILPTLLAAGALAFSASAEVPADVLRSLAEKPTRPNPATLDLAWPYLDSPDANIREAARRAIAGQPFETWKERALEEKSTCASLEALRAAAECCPSEQAAAFSPHLCEQITTLRLEEMDESQQFAAIQLTHLVFTQLGPVSADERRQMIDLWAHFSAARTPQVRLALESLRHFLERSPSR